MSDMTKEQQALNAFLLACKDQGMDGEAMQVALRSVQATAAPMVKRPSGRTIPDMTGIEHICQWQREIKPAAPPKD